jgi:hypothetical protein
MHSPPPIFAYLRGGVMEIPRVFRTEIFGVARHGPDKIVKTAHTRSRTKRKTVTPYTWLARKSGTRTHGKFRVKVDSGSSGRDLTDGTDFWVRVFRTYGVSVQDWRLDKRVRRLRRLRGACCVRGAGLWESMPDE